MVKFKSSFFKILMIIVISVQFTGALRNTPEGFIACLGTMIDTFGLNPVPIECVKYAIKHLSITNAMNNDFRTYYESMLANITTEDIQSPHYFCNTIIMVAGQFCAPRYRYHVAARQFCTPQHQQYENYHECRRQLQDFGIFINEILSTSLYLHKQSQQLLETENQYIHPHNKGLYDCSIGVLSE